MEFFLDTADSSEINFYRDFIDGVTTNPAIIAESGVGDIGVFVRDTCRSVSGPISVEVISEEYDSILEEGNRLAGLSDNVCVKLPCTFDGLRACKKLSASGIATNLTLCFSSTQALLAAKCGATYVSPFVGRLDDIGCDGMSLIEEIVDIFQNYGYETKVLVASVRNLQHVIQAAMLGADAITMPPAILKQCFGHPLTAKGLEIFKKAVEKTG
jgi:transaldolase